jgi:hypothetical protein
MIQRKCLIPLTARIRVAVAKRTRRSCRPTRICDRWRTIRAVRVAFGDGTAAISDCGDAVLLVAL